MKRVLKWTIPVDNQSHLIGSGKVVHVDCQFDPGYIQVWTEEDEQPHQVRKAQVFGTGHAIPVNARHIGSVVTANGQLVWHLYEVD